MRPKGRKIQRWKKSKACNFIFLPGHHWGILVCRKWKSTSSEEGSSCQAMRQWEEREHKFWVPQGADAPTGAFYFLSLARTCFFTQDKASSWWGGGIPLAVFSWYDFLPPGTSEAAESSSHTLIRFLDLQLWLCPTLISMPNYFHFSVLVKESTSLFTPKSSYTLKLLPPV